MWLRPGSEVSVALTDGTQFNGRVRFTWAFWRGVRLTSVTVETGQEPAEAAGEIRIPTHAIRYVQVVGK